MGDQSHAAAIPGRGAERQNHSSHEQAAKADGEILRATQGNPANAQKERVIPYARRQFGIVEDVVRKQGLGQKEHEADREDERGQFGVGPQRLCGGRRGITVRERKPESLPAARKSSRQSSRGRGHDRHQRSFVMKDSLSPHKNLTKIAIARNWNQ
jgi:hypothetical protein